MSYVADRVKETSTSTGTGTFTLAGAVTQFETFAANFSVGASYPCYYAITGQGSEWEVGIGHLSNSTTLVRDTVYASSNSDALVSFSAGSKVVRNVYPANAMGAFAEEETPSGSCNGSNTAFTLAHTPISGTLKLYMTAFRLKNTVDYTYSGASITMILVPSSTDYLLADYRF